jgi:hypothetical protein
MKLIPSAKKSHRNISELLKDKITLSNNITNYNIITVKDDKTIKNNDKTIKNKNNDTNLENKIKSHNENNDIQITNLKLNYDYQKTMPTSIFKIWLPFTHQWESIIRLMARNFDINSSYLVKNSNGKDQLIHLNVAHAHAIHSSTCVKII